MNTVKNVLENIKNFLNIPLEFGNIHITLWSIIYLTVLMIILFYATTKIKKWIVYQLLAKSKIDIGVRIAFGTIFRYVINISMRSTTIVTNDNIAIIVPNSEFISSKVINWSYTDRNVRFTIPVGVSYNDDPQIARKLLLDIADNNPGVLKNPKPEVLFDAFADSSLNFNLRVWTREFINRPLVLKSRLYFEIFAKFKEHNIEIPFPQRDIHIKNN